MDLGQNRAMASIEDLLQSDDSDDEEDPNVDLDAVDLELLLNSKEEDDDDESYVAMARASKSLGLPSVKGAESARLSTTGGSGDNGAANIEDFLKTIKLGGARADSTASDGFDSTLLFEGDEQEATPAEQSVAAGEAIESLRAAEAREQRSLLTTEKPPPSALQVRRQVQSADNPATLLHVDNLPMISSQLKRNLSYQLHGPGQGSAYCVSTKFLAIGTNKGYLIIFDHQQEIRRVLNSAQLVPQMKNAFITALACLPEGGCLVSAHKTGDIVFWDAARGTVLKHFRDSSNADLVNIDFLPSISFADPKFNSSIESEAFFLLSRAENHVVNRHKLSKSLLSGWHIETDCLLDNAKDAVVALAICHPGPPATAALTSVAATVDIRLHPTPLQLFAFSLKAMTAIVQVVPEVKIVHKWNVNSSASTSIEPAPLLEWGWLHLPDPAMPDGAGAVAETQPVPTLLRCAGAKIEVLTMRCASFTPKPSAGSAGASQGSAETGRRSSLYRLTSMLSAPEEVVPVPAFSYAVESTYDCHALGEHVFVYATRYVSAHHVVVLTDKEVLLFDPRLQLLERVGLAPEIKHHIQPYIHTHIYGSPALYPTSMISELFGDRLFVLLPGDMYTVSIRSPWEQVQQLVGAGKYIEGLAYIVDTVLKAPALLTTQRDQLRAYIYNYVMLAVKRPAPDAGQAALVAAQGSKVPAHLPLVASVCIEYCIHTNLLEILWHDIYNVFKSESRGEVLLEALENYIYTRQLTVLPPYIVTEYIQLALSRSRYKTIEKSILYLDVCVLDLNLIMRFLYTLRMYTSFFYVYSQGLGDYTGAAMQVFQQIRPIRGPGSDQVVEDAEMGYRLLLFSLYTFEDKVYPHGTPKAMDPATVFSLLEGLVCETFVAPQPAIGGQAQDWTGVSFPLLQYLTLLDPLAAFHVIGRGLDRGYHLLHSQRRVQQDGGGAGVAVDEGCQRLSRVVDVILRFSSANPSVAVPLDKLFFDRVHSVLFGAHGLHLSPTALGSLIRYCGQKVLSQRKGLEEDLRAYLDHQCRGVDAKSVTETYQALLQHKFFLAATSLRNLFVYPLHAEHTFVDVRAALSYYLTLPAPGVCFDFLALHLTGSTGRAPEELQRAAVVDKLADLIRVDLRRAVALCMDHLSGHMREVVEGMKHDPRTLFTFLSAYVEEFHRLDASAPPSAPPAAPLDDGTPAADRHAAFAQVGSASAAVEGGKESELFASSWSPDLLLQYVRLLCVYAPDSALQFLQTYHLYIQIDSCMSVVKEYHLYDCVAHLLERCGDTKTALEVLLKDTSARLRVARRDVDTLLRQEATSAPVGGRAPQSVKAFVSSVLSKGLGDLEALYAAVPCVVRVSKLLDCTVKMCSRQLARSADPGVQPEVQAWFEQTFDHFLQERRALRSGTMSSSSELLAQLLSHYLKHLIAHMRHVVPAQSIVTRLVQHAAAMGLKLAEFRDVFAHMLESAVHEREMGGVVTAVLRGDVLGQQQLKLGHMRAFAFKSAVLEVEAEGAPAVASAAAQDAVSEVQGREEAMAAAERRARRLRGRPLLRMDAKSMRTRCQEALFAQQARTTPTHMGYVRVDSDDRSFAGRMNAVAFHNRSAPEDIAWH